MKLNVGCGDFPIIGEGWVNLDADPASPADVHQYVPPLPYDDASLEHVWACHFLEHLNRDRACEFLAECYRCLMPGGSVGIVVPDTREVMRRYVAGTIDAVEWPLRQYWPVADLDAVCALFLYSTVQGTPHQWSYDERTLARILTGAGFVHLTPIHRYTDPRLGSGAWYQCGFEGRKPGGAA